MDCMTSTRKPFASSSYTTADTSLSSSTHPSVMGVELAKWVNTFAWMVAWRLAVGSVKVAAASRPTHFMFDTNTGNIDRRAPACNNARRRTLAKLDLSVLSDNDSYMRTHGPVRNACSCCASQSRLLMSLFRPCCCCCCWFDLRLLL